MASKLCTIPNCEKRQIARGWCDMHYKRWQVNGDPLYKKKYPDTCIADGCSRADKITKGYCPKHYARLLRHNDANYLNRAEAGEGELFIRNSLLNANKTDCIIWPFAKTKGYGVVYLRGKMVLCAQSCVVHFFI